MGATILTKKLDKDYFEKVTAIALTDGYVSRTVFLQKFTVTKMVGEAKVIHSQSFWVSDGFYNKKEYKSNATASRAFREAIGDLILLDYEITDLDDGFLARFSKD